MENPVSLGAAWVDGAADLGMIPPLGAPRRRPVRREKVESDGESCASGWKQRGWSSSGCGRGQQLKEARRPEQQEERLEEWKGEVVQDRPTRALEQRG